MQFVTTDSRHRPLQAPKLAFGYGGKVHCSLVAPTKSDPDVLQVVPDQPFATTYPSYRSLQKLTDKR